MVFGTLGSAVSSGRFAASADYFANPSLNLAPFSRWTLRDKLRIAG